MAFRHSVPYIVTAEDILIGLTSVVTQGFQTPNRFSTLKRGFGQSRFGPVYRPDILNALVEGDLAT